MVLKVRNTQFASECGSYAPTFEGFPQKHDVELRYLWYHTVTQLCILKLNQFHLDNLDKFIDSLTPSSSHVTAVSSHHPAFDYNIRTNRQNMHTGRWAGYW